MSEKRFFFHQFSTNSLSGIQFRNPFNSRIIVWEIEKSEKSSRVLGWVCQCLSDRRAHFPHFHFHPRRDFVYLAIISSSKIFVYFHILCIFANLVAHLKDPKWESSILWDDIDGCKYFPKQSLLVVCTLEHNLRWKEIFARLRLLFVGKKLLIFVIQIYDFVHSQSCEERSGSRGCLRRMKVEWISCLFKSWSWAAARSVTHNRLIFTNLSLTLSSSLAFTIHLTSMIR